jgi:hypothetical protein
MIATRIESLKARGILSRAPKRWYKMGHMRAEARLRGRRFFSGNNAFYAACDQ